MKFFELLNKSNKDALVSIVEEGVTYESKMLKATFGDMDIIKMPAVELYRYHFVLFHLLYTMQNEYANEGKYLHVHFMRTGLFDYPDFGKCAYFDENTMKFCDSDNADEFNHCEFHSEKLGVSSVESLSLKYFYLDALNYDKLDKVSAESLLSGAWEVLSGEDSLPEAYALLGLYGHENLVTVKSRFRELAKKNHPDQNGGDRDKFIELNRAYRLICGWLETSNPIRD